MTTEEGIIREEAAMQKAWDRVQAENGYEFDWAAERPFRMGWKLGYARGVEVAIDVMVNGGEDAPA